jgi:AbrB family looped-hinge helix DNA binding protein
LRTYSKNTGQNHLLLQSPILGSKDITFSRSNYNLMLDEKLEIEELSDFEIVVKRKGQITIPAKIRKKYKIDKGTYLKVVTIEDGVLLTPKKSIWDMIGNFSDKASVYEMNHLHNKLRHEKKNE